jgi:hypothetical protein
MDTEFKKYNFAILVVFGNVLVQDFPLNNVILINEGGMLK